MSVEKEARHLPPVHADLVNRMREEIRDQALLIVGPPGSRELVHARRAYEKGVQRCIDIVVAAAVELPDEATIAEVLRDAAAVDETLEEGYYIEGYTNDFAEAIYKLLEGRNHG